MFCDQKRLIQKQFKVECPSGSIHDLDVVKYGAFDRNLTNTKYCSDEAIWEKEDKRTNVNCSAYVD